MCRLNKKKSQAFRGNNLYMVLEQILIRLEEHSSSLSLHENITHTHTCTRTHTYTYTTKDIALLHNHTGIHTYPSLTSAQKITKEKKKKKTEEQAKIRRVRHNKCRQPIKFMTITEKKCNRKKVTKHFNFSINTKNLKM